MDIERINLEQTRISAEPPSVKEYFWSCWEMRAIIWVLAKRQLKVRHAGTRFGILWILLQPLPSIAVFTFFFGQIINVQTGSIPYAIFALIGLVSWNYFTFLSVSMGNILYQSGDVIKKIRFPRLLLLISQILSGGVEFVISLVLVVVAMVFYGISPNANLLLLPLFVSLNILFGWALGIWLCILTYQRKDLMQVIPVIINFSIWLTPVFFPTSALPPVAENLMFLNPMALVCDGLRYTIAAGPAPSLIQYGSIPIALVVAVLGLVRFKNIDAEIPEHI